LPPRRRQLRALVRFGVAFVVGGLSASASASKSVSSPASIQYSPSPAGSSLSAASSSPGLSSMRPKSTGMGSSPPPAPRASRSRSSDASSSLSSAVFSSPLSWPTKKSRSAWRSSLADRDPGRIAGLAGLRSSSRDSSAFSSVSSPGSGKAPCPSSLSSPQRSFQRRPSDAAPAPPATRSAAFG
jgi:hypothetical protein